MKIKSFLKALIILGIASVSLIYYYNQKSSDLNLPKTESIDMGHGVSMEFVLIQPGSFTMGSSLYVGEGDEAPEHKVTITKPFYLGEVEVTQEQWEAIMGNNPSKFKGGKLPVDSVRWDESQMFIKKLQEHTGHLFTLPTEAEWEYAARAGTDTKWHFGDNEAHLTDYAWFGENSDEGTNPVGQKKPNAWGLYDMYGNVQEWCKDWYAHSYPDDEASNPQGPDTGDSRVLRGGAWGDDLTMVRSAYRNAAGADAKTSGMGFRVAMSID